MAWGEMEVKHSWRRKWSKGHHTLGIEITDSHVKICEIQHNGHKSLRVTNHSTRALDAGIVDDGRMLDREGLKDAIKATLGARRFGTRFMHFAVPSQSVLVRTLKLPDIAHGELKKLVQFEMQNNLSLAFDDPHYDFIKLPKAAARSDQETSLCDVLVVAAPMNVLREYVRLFEELKLIPCSMEIKSFSLLRLLEFTPLRFEGVQLVVNVNQLNTEMMIIEDGGFKITRNVEVAFQSLVADHAAESDDWLNGYSNPEQTFQNAAQDLISEMERLMNFYYYNINKGEKPFQSIVLSGDLSDMDRLKAFMETRLTPPVQLLDWAALAVGRNSLGWSVPAYAVPIGLALRGKEA